MYEWQIQQTESQSKALIQEIRRLAKAQALGIQAQASLSLSDQTVLIEKGMKNLKLTIKKLSEQLEVNIGELSKYRQKDRIYELQKRCLEDSNKKAAAFYQKLNQM